MSYPLDWAYQEVAYLGLHVHWTHEDVMNMDHQARRRWIDEVRRLEASP